MKYRNQLSIFILGATLLLTSCESSIETLATDSYPISKKNEVFTQATSKYLILRAEDSANAFNNLFNYFKSLPDLKNTELMPDRIIKTQFPDNSWYLFSDNYTPSGDSNVTKKRQSPTIQSNTIVPGGNECAVFTAMGATFGNSPSMIATYLQSAGYQLKIIGFKPDELKDAGLHGVIYIYTHGQYLGEQPYSPDFYLWTSQDVDSISNEEYRDDLRSGIMVYSTALYDRSGDVPKYETRYSISGDFINRYNVIDRSRPVFMYLDACSGFASSKFASSIVSHDSSVFFGWTHPAFANVIERTSTLFFSSLLGSPVFKKNGDMYYTPPVRPFDYLTVYGQMKKSNALHGDYANFQENDDNAKHWNNVYPEGFELLYRRGNAITGDIGSNKIFLAPSIYTFTSVLDSMSKIRILGEFSDQIGIVKVSDGVKETILPISSWTPTQIVCSVPDSGDGATGDLTVESNGIRSNPVPMTEWRGLFTYKYSKENAQTVDIDFTLHLRIDARRIRDKFNYHLDDTTVWSSLGNMLVPDSKCHYQFSGQYYNSISKYTVNYSGTGDASHRRNVNESGGFMGSISLDPASTQPKISMGISCVKVSEFKGIVTTTPDGGSPQVESINGFRSIPMFANEPYITLVLDTATYSIQAGQYQYTYGDETVTLTWPEISATSIPSSRTPGRQKEKYSGSR